MTDRERRQPSSISEPTGASESVRQLVAQLEEEQRTRWQRGERVLVEAYLEQHPRLQTQADGIVDLLYNEFLLREQAGEAPRLEDYLKRFPQLADQLRDQFEVHGALQSEQAGNAAAGQVQTIFSASSSASYFPETTAFPVVPDYEIVKELGRGGMGVVYLAWQHGLNRLAALKMILAGDYASPQELTRFRTEAEAVGRLEHPHIVHIYEVGAYEGRPYLSLEYAEGGSLAQKLAGAPLPSRSAAELVGTLARAMHYAHERGIVHRDLTPGNVLLTAAGVPKITDFGLAKILVGGGAVQTQSGAIVGTPSYMAPEQARGKIKEITPAADVYALGAILYELLTGRPPFRAETPLETVLQLQSQEPVPPRHLHPKLPRDLETICLKCLQKEPQQRYGSTEALAEDLERWLAGEPIRARRSSAWERTVKWARRRPAVASLLALVVLLALVGFGAVAWQWHEAEQARAQALRKADDEEKARARAEQAQKDEAAARQKAEHERDAKEKALLKAEGLRLAARSEIVRSTNPGQALLLAIEGARRYRGLDANNALLAALDACHEHRTIIGHKGQVRYAAFSPDGRRLLTYSADETARLWDADTGAPLHVLGGHKPYCVYACWSPDGTRVLTGSAAIYGGGELWSREINSFFTFHTWDAATGERLAMWKDPGSYDQRSYRKPLIAAAFSPDSRRVITAACVFPGWPTVHDADTGKELAALKEHQGPPSAAAWSLDGRRLVTGALDGTACVWDADSYQLLHTLRGQKDAIALVVFSPDSKRVLSVGDGRAYVFLAQGERVQSDVGMDPSARVWELEGGTERAVFKFPKKDWGPIRTASWSPDGKWIVTGGNGAPLTGSFSKGGGFPEFPLVWDAAKGEPVLVLAPPSGTRDYVPGIFSAAFSSDGRWIVTADKGRTARLWDLGRRIAIVEWRAPEGYAFQLADQGLKVPVGELRTPAMRAEFRGHEGEVYTAAFSPDGRRVVTASEDGTARVWDADLSDDVHHPDASRPRKGRWRRPGPVALSRDGRRIAAGHEWDGRHQWVRVWDTATGEKVAELQGDSTIATVAFGADGKTLVTGGDGTARIWDLTTRTTRHVLAGHQGYVEFVDVSPDGSLVLTIEGYKKAHVWDAATGERRFTLAPQELVSKTAFSLDGRRIAMLTKDRYLVKVFDTATGKELFSVSQSIETGLSGTWAGTVCFSADGGRVLASFGSGASQVWDAGTGRELVLLKAPQEELLHGAAFSPDSSRIVTSSMRKKTPRIWDARTGKQLAILTGHDGLAWHAAFSPDGSLIVTASEDKTARVWDAGTAKELLTLKHDTRVLWAAFTPDGRQVLTVADDVARLWPLDPLPVAEQRRPRELTKVEKEQFGIGAGEQP